MHEGRTINTIVGEIMENATTRRDFVLPTSTLVMDEELRLGWTDAAPITLTDLAHDQVAGFLGIPTKFYDRLRREVPDLIQVNVNRLMREHADEHRLVRTLPGRGRAFLSNRYRPLDNEDLAAHVLPLIQDRGFTIQSAQLTDTRLFLQVVSPKIEGEVRVGDAVQAGFILTNSEVGKGSLSIQPLVFRLRCTNGMVISEMAQRKAHLGGRTEGFIEGEWELVKDDTREASDKALWLTMRDAVDHFTSPEGFQKVLGKLKDSADTPVTGQPVAVVKEVTKAFGLRESENLGILTEFLRSGDNTRWGMANAITAQAHTTEDYERSVELEAMGGKLMAMPTREFSRLASVTE